ncbi:MAG: TetR/AcrR family transcriptional regulator [Myxococcota bacterium]
MGGVDQRPKKRAARGAKRAPSQGRSRADDRGGAHGGGGGGATSRPLGPDERRDRILDVAIQLAEDGGFDNVRQRDVARLSGVALGTLYKSFRSKEDILAAALHRETETLERRLDRKPARGDTAAERLRALFVTLTRSLLKKPSYARALLKAMTSGEEVATKVVAHQVAVTRMVVAAQRGCPPSELADQEPPTVDEINVAIYLQNLWFAGLVGWSAKLHGQQRIVDQVSDAARLILAGLEATRGGPADADG